MIEQAVSSLASSMEGSDKKLSTMEKKESVDKLFGKKDDGEFSKNQLFEKDLGKEKIQPLDGKPIKLYNVQALAPFKEKPIEPITKTMSPEWKGVADKTSNLEKKSKEVKTDDTLKKKDTSENKNSEVKKITCINEYLESQKHPETGVPYEKKMVENDKGEKVEGVFPVFESKFDAQLPEELEQASDLDQMKECTKQLKEALNKDPELRKQFTKEQLEQIENEKPRIRGYSWHHNEERGKMQLVDFDIHKDSKHTGGRAIWGGGSNKR